MTMTMESYFKNGYESILNSSSSSLNDALLMMKNHDSLDANRSYDNLSFDFTKLQSSIEFSQYMMPDTNPNYNNQHQNISHTNHLHIQNESITTNQLPSLTESSSSLSALSSSSSSLSPSSSSSLNTTTQSQMTSNQMLIAQFQQQQQLQQQQQQHHLQNSALPPHIKAEMKAESRPSSSGSSGSPLGLSPTSSPSLNSHQNALQLIASANNSLVPFQSIQTEYFDITPYITYSQEKAAKKLGIPKSTLSKRWREATCNRKWPYRQLCKVDREIKTLVHNMQSTNGLSDPQLQANLAALMKLRLEESRVVFIKGVLPSGESEEDSPQIGRSNNSSTNSSNNNSPQVTHHSTHPYQMPENVRYITNESKSTEFQGNQVRNVNHLKTDNIGVWKTANESLQNSIAEFTRSQNNSADPK